MTIIPQQQGTVTDISLHNETSNNLTTTTINLTDDESAAPAITSDPRHLLVAYESRRRSRVHQLNVQWLSQFKNAAGERDGLLGSCHAGLMTSSAIPPLPVLESHPDDVFFKSHKNLEELIDFTVLHESEPFSDDTNNNQC